jgi:hypothetical protein
VSTLAETLATACVLSALAAGGLGLLKRTPPRVQFALAAAGLAVWLVPWGSFSIALPSSGAAVAAPLVEWLGATLELAPEQAEPAAAATALLGYGVAAAFLVGLALLVRDCLALRRCVRAWRARSRPADELKSLLPPDLAGVAAEIRVVEGSAVAAASGVWRPTIWLGDRHTGAQLTLALAHEIWHVRARDPAWLLAIAAVRRLYWWNPLVAQLARHAVLMLESACDHRCAAQFGHASYAARLASLLLAATVPMPRLVATAGSLDVQRLKLLGQPLTLRSRDLALLVAVALLGAGAAAAAVVERTPSGPAPLGIALPETPAGHALSALLGAANGGDTELLVELLGAYTPQELPMPLPSSPSVRIVELRESSPLSIAYVVESANGARYVGELAVSVSATTEITATRLRPLP